MRKRFIIPLFIIVVLSLMTIYDLVPYQEQIQITQSDFVQTQHELHILYNSTQGFILNTTIEINRPNFSIIDSTILSSHRNLTMKIFMTNTSSLLLSTEYTPGMQLVQNSSTFFLDNIGQRTFSVRFYSYNSFGNFTFRVTTVLGYQITVLFQRLHKVLFSEIFRDIFNAIDSPLLPFIVIMSIMIPLDILAYRYLKDH
ncbi:MAG: hypothetical protein EAX87_07250 [Candidatus Thorarchaeota archaeon]|nr:hypothetical protein [Candidatus Thorarchaeota archaeon]